VAVPWRLLTDLGHEVVFATESGGAAPRSPGASTPCWHRLAGHDPRAPRAGHYGQDTSG
jgi:hypothetical protein